MLRADSLEKTLMLGKTEGKRKGGVAVPAAAVDPEPANTSFVHRAFLTQYTGTGTTCFHVGWPENGQ